MNYPFKEHGKYQKNVVDYRNRGMDLESLINQANEYYLDMDKAVIYKKPTPIGIIHVDYSVNKITDAYFKDKSTFDYNGIYRNRYIDFEAKESHSKTSFPLSNISEHQIKHLRRILKHGAVSFLIVSIRGEYYLLKGEDLLDFIDKNERKSIPYEFFKTECYKIEERLRPAIDYLRVVDEVYFKGE